MDFFLKINSPSAGRNSGDSALPLLFCIFCLLDKPFTRLFTILPHPLPHSLRINISLVSWARPFTKPLCWRLIFHCCSALVQLQNLVCNSGVCLEEAEQQAEVNVDVLPLLFKLSSQFPFVSFVFLSISISLLLFSILALLPFLIFPSSLTTIPSFFSDNSLSS